MRAGSASPSTRSSALDGVDLDLSVGQVHGLVGPNGAGKTTLLGLLLGRRRSRPTLLCAALGLQAIGIALPALAGGPVTAVTAAVLFRATFLGVGSLSLALGAHLQVPRAVALLTVGYGVGQIIGPLIAAPLLPTGYPRALGVAAGIVATSAVAAGLLRLRYPHRVGASVEPSRAARRRPTPPSPEIGARVV